MINPAERVRRIEALIDGVPWDDEAARRDAIAHELTELCATCPRPSQRG